MWIGIFVCQTMSHSKYPGRNWHNPCTTVCKGCFLDESPLNIGMSLALSSALEDLPHTCSSSSATKRSLQTFVAWRLSRRIRCKWIYYLHSNVLQRLTTQYPLHKKWSSPLKISSVNVTKSAGNCGFGHIYWKKSLMENFIFCAVIAKIGLTKVFALLWFKNKHSNAKTKMVYQAPRQSRGTPVQISLEKQSRCTKINCIHSTILWSIVPSDALVKTQR